MVATAMIASLVLTFAVLALTLLTISKGYGYKHTIDPKVTNENEEQIKEE